MSESSSGASRKRCDQIRGLSYTWQVLTEEDKQWVVRTVREGRSHLADRVSQVGVASRIAPEASCRSASRAGRRSRITVRPAQESRRPLIDALRSPPFRRNAEGWATRQQVSATRPSSTSVRNRKPYIHPKALRRVLRPLEFHAGAGPLLTEQASAVPLRNGEDVYRGEAQSEPNGPC